MFNKLHKKKLFSQYAWAYLLYNVYVILGGAYVRATGSGAGCGAHWPLCNGEFIPHFSLLHTVIEYTHRASSGLVTIGGLVLLGGAFACTPKHHAVRKAAGFSFLFIVVEALLGASLVLFHLVEYNSSALRAGMMALHLATTFLLLASIALTAAWSSGFPIFKLQPTKKCFIVFTLIGGLFIIGTSGAVTALGDTLFRPHSVGENLAAEFISPTHFLKSVRILHPVFAVSIAFFLVLQCWKLTPKNSSVLQIKLCQALSVTVLIQLLFGFINIALLAPLWMQIVHLLTADIVWVVCVLFF